MRQQIKFLLAFLIIGIMYQPGYAVVKGGLEYQIPVDYTKLSQEELETKAGFYYNLALKTGSVNEEMTQALNLYSILNTKCPDEILYPIRLGILYDTIGMDKYAKGNLSKAIGIDSTNPEAYFYFGEFYYKRSMFKKALKMYKEAYKKGYSRHYETLYRIGDIYEKFGDTEASLRYLKQASELSPNSELDNKIIKVENAHQTNKEYYSNTRIRLIER